MQGYYSDARSSLRILRRSPGLASSAVLALAIGIGLTTTMYSIVRGGTRSLPFANADQLVVLTRTNIARGFDVDPGRFDYLVYSGAQRSFSGLAAFEAWSLNLGDDAARPERIPGALVTPGTFALLGVQPQLGRVLQADDALPGAPAVVVLGHDLWRTRYDGDSGVIGRTIRLDGSPRTVIGVMPPGFAFPVRGSFWSPLVVESTAVPVAGATGLRVFGRLRDDVSLDQARADVAVTAARLAREHQATHGTLSARVYPFVELEMAPNTPAILYLMLGAVSFVLLIAAANVANLLLARAATRSREFAVRTALGASRGRLIALHLSESLLLSALGGLLGLGFAYIAVGAFDAATAGILDAFWIDFRVDGMVVLFGTLTVGAAGIAAGLVPGLRASRADVAEVLKDAPAGATGVRIGRLARALVLAEVALATGLLIMTMTFTRTAVALRSVEMPFEAREILTAQFGFTQPVLASQERRERVVREIESRLGGLPGVSGVALVSTLPGRGAGNPIFSLDAPRVAGDAAALRTTGLSLVTPGFIDVLGSRVLRGRGLTWDDRQGAASVALVNESWVRLHSADRDPLGRRIWFGDVMLEIVGVVPDLQMQDPEDRVGDGVYASVLQLRPYVLRAMVRTTLDPLAYATPIRDIAASVDPDLPVLEVATLYDAIYADKKVLEAFGAIFLAAGVGALFLTMLGVYGIVSFGVTSRTREIGVRVALGASRLEILRLVLRQGGSLIGYGVGIGLVLAFGLSQALAAATEFIQPAAPSTYAMIAAALLLTAAVGLLRPIRRALSLQPMEALRYE